MGIEDPNHENTFLNIIELSDQGMVTSGDYRRYVTIENEKYSHIIDPKTGMPIKDMTSVTLVGDNILDLDVWATAFSALGLEKAKYILESQTQMSYYILYKNKEEGYDFITNVNKKKA